MKKYIIYFLIGISIFGIIMIKSLNIFAAEEISITSDRENIGKGEEFEILINLKQAKLSSFEIEMYFDKDKLEYMSGPEDINLTEYNLTYTWTDETGGSSPKQEGEIVRFKFRAKEIGEAVFEMNGTFFDEEGNSVTPEIKGITITILDTVENEVNVDENEMDIDENEIDMIEEEEEINENEVDIDTSNTYLQTMRLGVEGISPNFDKNITEYTVVVPNDVDKLNLEAIPEDLGAKVNIIGDTVLKTGLNVAKIEVVSEDGMQNREYTINITKTKDTKEANANLETLAVEYYMLEPLFAPNITEYRVEVSNSTDKINLFAIPESTKANVSVNDNGKLEYGKNIVTVTVIAENGVTKKIYKVNIYRRNQEEEEKFIKDREENSKKLNEIIEKQEVERLFTEQENQNNHISTNQKNVAAAIALSGTAVLVIGYLVFNKKIKINWFK